MAFDRKRLFRGTKLTVDRVNEVHAGVTTSVGNGLGASVQPGPGRFFMVWNLPSIESYMFDGLIGNELNFSKILIPFVIPPPQEATTDTGIIDETTPIATLVRISVGFDQVGTGRAFTDMWSTGGGCNDYDLQSGGYGFELALWEKTPARLTTGGLTAGPSRNVLENLVWSQTLGGSLFDGPVASQNPVDIKDLRITCQPYRSYVWTVRFTDLLNATTTTGLGRDIGASSFHLVAEFVTPLLSRDTTTVGTQNLPTAHGGQRQVASISLDTATPDSIITAEIGLAANGRVQKNLEAIDAKFATRLTAGYDRQGRLPTAEELIEDQTWSVLTVPMFAQIGDIRAIDINTIGLPWGPQGGYSLANWPGEISDRRLIRIQHPFVIHHIVAVANYYSPPTVGGAKANRAGTASGLIPTSATYTNKVGVAIGSGIDGAEDRRYQQIAYLEWTPATKASWVIDRLKEGGTPPLYGLGTAGDYDHELFFVPLVNDVFLTSGLYGLPSGPPVYTGRGELDTEARTTIAPMPWSFGGGAKTPPATAGREQFLEVRWTMTDSNSLSTNNPAVSDETCYVGNGGCWVYIFGKKSPVPLEG